MTNEKILEIALQHSAWDMNCGPEDFLKEENVMVDFHLGEHARKYYREPIACNFVSYGNNVVASVKPEYKELVAEYLQKFEYYRCFETPSMHWLSERFAALGQKVCFMAEYYLPDIRLLKPLECDYELRVLHPADFQDLYTDDWGNALCADRKELDVLGVGAFDGEKLVGMAACSADGEEMWQIGVDVLPAYRRKGIAAAVVSHLALEIIERGKVPFYCSAWSNLRSMRTAIKCGFLPGWVEMTVKSAEVVDGFNR